jgi:hypothetical protein
MFAKRDVNFEADAWTTTQTSTKKGGWFNSSKKTTVTTTTHVNGSSTISTGRNTIVSGNKAQFVSANLQSGDGTHVFANGPISLLNVVGVNQTKTTKSGLFGLNKSQKTVKDEVNFGTRIVDTKELADKNIILHSNQSDVEIVGSSLKTKAMGQVILSAPNGKVKVCSLSLSLSLSLCLINLLIFLYPVGRSDIEPFCQNERTKIFSFVPNG